MYCKHCGKLIEEDSNFCRHCGTPVRFVLTTTEADLFDQRMKSIEKKTYPEDPSMLKYIVFYKETTECHYFTNSLASCDMPRIAYIISIHKHNYKDFNGYNRSSYHLLGIYNDQLEQITSIPLTDSIEIYNVGTGDSSRLALLFRNPQTQKRIGEVFGEVGYSLSILKDKIDENQ